MKKIIIGIFTFFIIVNSYSQRRNTVSTPPRIPCGTDQLYEKSLRDNPNLAKQLQEQEKKYQKAYAEKAQMRTTTTTNSTPIVIPVVFYVVTPSTGDVSNILYTRITEQLAALNSAFNGTNIQFCMATKSATTNYIPYVSGSFPDVNVPQIIRVYNSSIATHDISTIASQQALLGTAHQNITKDKYLRIWIVKDIVDSGQPTGILGYSPMPLTSSILDGVVIRYDAIGGPSNCVGCLPDYTQGKTLAHEVGHYLGLYHTFQDGCLGSDSGTCMDKGDRVCDTAQSLNPISSCNATINSCPENSDNDNLDNFMCYSDEPCRTTFTTGQVERMMMILNAIRPTLFSLENRVEVGACATNLVSAAITSTSYQFCVNDTTVRFDAPYTDTTTYSYLWNFGAPSQPNNTATTPQVYHTYTSAVNSPFTVTLTVTRNSDGVSATTTKKVYVTACQSIVSPQGTWITGYSNLLSFSSGVPAFDPWFPLNQSLQVSDAIQNDASGNPLFYTNKVDVYDNTYNSINTGGTPIALDTWGNGAGFSAMIVPKPNQSGKYYIFANTTRYAEPAFESYHGFRFSEIEVVSGSAVMNSIRQPIFDSTMGSFFQVQQGAFYGGEGVTAIKKNTSSADQSYWIITTLKGVDDKTYIVVFLFGKNGALSYFSHFLSPKNYSISTVALEASPNGNKIFMYNDGYADSSYILDFNKALGIISDPKEITINTLGAVEGASFSPDSNLLYYTEAQKILYQVNLNSLNPNQTKIVIVDEQPPRQLTQMQLGPDGKVYLDGYGTDCLKVIHKPNQLCTPTDYNKCDYYLYGPKLTSGYPETGSGMPNNIDAQPTTAYPNNMTSISYYLTGCNTYKFFPDYYGTVFSWDFGDTGSGSFNTSTAANPTHTFTVGTAPQYTYTVTLKNSAGTVIAQRQVIIDNPIYTITGSTATCSTSMDNATSNIINLFDGDTVVWSITGGSIQSGGNQSNVMAHWTTLPGTLTATVTTKAGCTKTVSVTINQLCCQENITLSTTESTTTTTYNANNSVTTNTNYVLNSGYTSTLKSGNTIVLKQNSHIKSGSSFLAILETCEGNQLVNKSIPIVEAIAQPVKETDYSRPLHDESALEEGIENGLIKNSISLYPNPSSKLVTLYSTAEIIKRVTVISTDGKQILSEAANDTSYQLNVSNFSKGIYIISIETAKGEIVSKKLIKE